MDTYRKQNLFGNGFCQAADNWQLSSDIHDGTDWQPCRRSLEYDLGHSSYFGKDTARFAWRRVHDVGGLDGHVLCRRDRLVMRLDCRYWLMTFDIPAKGDAIFHGNWGSGLTYLRCSVAIIVTNELESVNFTGHQHDHLYVQCHPYIHVLSTSTLVTRKTKTKYAGPSFRACGLTPGAPKVLAGDHTEAATTQHPLVSFLHASWVLGR